MRSMAEDICSRMTRMGRSKPAMSVMVSTRDRVSRGLLEWMVVSEPSWPVFMAWSMSRASPPRHSPTMIRSGRIRRELRMRSRIVISPRPSMLGGRDSSDATCSWRSWSSLESSMVTMRSSLGTNPDSTLSSVVFPVSVPPDTMMLSLPTTHASMNRARAEVMVRFEMRSSTCKRVLGELPDGEERPPVGEGVDDGVDTGAVGQTGVDHGRRLVHAPADLTHDLVDDPAQVRLVDEAGRRALDLAVALDVDLVGPVDHDLGHLGVLEIGLDGPVPEDVVGDVLAQSGLVGQASAVWSRRPGPPAGAR